jgi:Lipocalin-like domain
VQERNVRPTILLSLVLVLTNLLPASFAASRQADSSLESRLLATWRLVSIGSIRPDGTLEPDPDLGPHAIGYLMYDATGHMCVSLANPNHPRWADPQKPTTAERLQSYDAMFAHCATYEVQEKESRVIHRPEMASWPHYIGSDQVRNIRMEGNPFGERNGSQRRTA